SCGISEAALEAIFQEILKASVERQHRIGVAGRTSRGGRILILGGAGAMGGWLRTFFELVGHRVETVDPAQADPGPPGGAFSRLEEVADLDAYDAVVLATPLAGTAEVLERVVERRPRGLVVEIASIKSPLKPALDRAEREGVEVSSLHPMFGPGKHPYQPLTFVLACRRPAEEERKDLEPLLRHPYTRVVPIPFEHHDRLMGWLLGLAHLTSMLFGSALTRSGIEADEFHDLASTTFRRQAATALSVLNEDPDLYLDIQHLNPHREEVYEAARQALEELESRVAARDREGFRRLLDQARRAVEPRP
ncbi:MAG: prephenate dehydrogenase/arogenate dehydrogenase family protein, partial [Planctomycetota bacterium]